MTKGIPVFLHDSLASLLHPYYGLLVGLSIYDIEKFFKKVNDQAERIKQTFTSSHGVPRVTVSSIVIYSTVLISAYCIRHILMKSTHHPVWDCLKKLLLTEVSMERCVTDFQRIHA